jgi:hypothetical protein
VLAEPRQQRPARRIGQGRERAIQRLCLILNHVVKYVVPDAQSQVRTLSGHPGASNLSAVIPGPERSEGARNPVTTACDYWIPGSPLRGAPE